MTTVKIVYNKALNKWIALPHKKYSQEQSLVQEILDYMKLDSNGASTVPFPRSLLTELRYKYYGPTNGGATGITKTRGTFKQFNVWYDGDLIHTKGFSPTLVSNGNKFKLIFWNLLKKLSRFIVSDTGRTYKWDRYNSDFEVDHKTSPSVNPKPTIQNTLTNYHIVTKEFNSEKRQVCKECFQRQQTLLNPERGCHKKLGFVNSKIKCVDYKTNPDNLWIPIRNNPCLGCPWHDPLKYRIASLLKK